MGAPLPTPFKICMFMHHNDIIIEKHTLDLIIIQLYKDLPLPTLLENILLGGRKDGICVYLFQCYLLIKCLGSANYLHHESI